MVFWLKGISFPSIYRFPEPLFNFLGCNPFHLEFGGLLPLTIGGGYIPSQRGFSTFIRGSLSLEKAPRGSLEFGHMWEKYISFSHVWGVYNLGAKLGCHTSSLTKIKRLSGEIWAI